jgi:HAD superfamily hydrolase (TIGR01509 family)
MSPLFCKVRQQLRLPLELVIFDCDGVLIDSEPVANRICAAAISRLGWEMSAMTCQQLFLGMNLDAMMPVIEARLGKSIPQDWPAALEQEIVTTMRREARPMPGAKQALEAAAGVGVPFRVASNSSHTEMAAKFASAGISDMLVGRAHSYRDVPQGKPAPDLFLAAARAEKVPPASCLVIEDSLPGVLGARAAGMVCLGSCPHGEDRQLRQAGAIPFASLFDLPALFRCARACP